MNNNHGVKILAFVGMAGSGKSTAVDYVVDKGYPKIYVGGVVYDEMRQRGIEITAQSQTNFREKMRQQHGEDYFMKQCIDRMNNLIQAGQKQIVLDGLYTWEEYKLLNREFRKELLVVAIVASKKLRHRRLSKRTERPFNEHEATERDWSEIEKLKKGGPIAIAHHYIMNESDVETFYQAIDKITENA